LLERARVLILAGRPLLAIDDSKRAVKLQPASMRARIELAEALLDAGQPENAAKLDVDRYLRRGEDKLATASPSGGGLDGRRVLVGKEKFLTDSSVNISDELRKQADRLQEQAQTTVWVAADGHALGILGIADPIKPTTRNAIRALHEMGLKIIMCTGDNRRTAESVARELGIDEFRAEVMPDEKIEIVERLKANGAIVAMAGDGINDAPALAAADVGIAMGTGTDVAIESASITLVKGDLLGIVKTMHLSRAVMRNIRQNLFFAFIYNALGVPIAAGVLYPFLGVLLSPMIAGAAMSFSSVSVIANALRLRRIEL